MRKAFLLLILFLALPAVSQAQSVDLLWQANTYTPPFYKGRALWTNESTVTFLAMPNGLGNPASLNYRWIRNGTVLGNISGVGRNSLSYTDSILGRPQTIRVEVISSNNSILASSTVSIAPSAPSLAIYENNPLYGFMFHRETGGAYELRDSEVTFAAFPYFFSATQRFDPSMRYEWRTNVGGTENMNSATYRAPEGVAGSSQISVRANSATRILQEARKNFLVQFGNR